MPDIQGGTIRYTLRGEDQNLSKLLQDVTNAARTAATSFGSVTIEVKETTAAMKQQESQLLRVASAQAKLFASQGNYNKAAQVLGGALGQVNNQTVQSINAQTQLSRIQQQASGTSQTFAGSLKEVGHQLGLFGALFVGQQVAGFVGDLVKGANDLEKVKATIGALTKSQEEYDAVLKLAGDQQKIFGGNLTENLRSLGAFVNLSQRTGVQLKDLENAARRLAIIDPIQGFEGAAVALKEFFSGDITSLSRRFEIPRSELNRLKDIQDPIDRFKELDKVLTDLGFSNEVLTAQAKTTANTYDQLAAQFDNAKNAVGGYIAELLKVPAQVITKAVFEPVANNLPNASTQVVADKKLEVQTNFLQQAQNVDQFNAAVSRANGIINQTSVAVGLMGGYFDKLSPSMFNAAKAAQESGTSIETIFKGIATAGPAVDAASAALIRLGTAPGRTAEDIANINDQLAALAVSGDQGAQQAYNLARAFLNGNINAQQLQVALQNIAASNAAIALQLDRTTQAQNLATTGGAQYNTILQSLGISTKDTADATNEYNTKLTEAIAKEQASAASTDTLKQLKEALANIAPQVAGGLISEANAAAYLANQFGIATSQAEGLIDAQIRLARVGDVLKAGQEKNTRVLAKPFADSPGKQGTGDVNLVLKQIEENKKLAQAERDLAEARGGNAVKLQNLKNDLSKLNAGSVEYLNTQRDIVLLEQSMAKKGGGSGAPKLSAQEKLNNSLAANQDKFNDKTENAERDHQQKLLDIQEEFAAKQLASQKASEITKRSSRADFYANLIEQDGVDQQKFAAQYEDAFKEAQDLAAKGQFELSQELLKARQQQIQDDIDYEKKRKEIQDNKSLTKKEKQNKLAALEGVNNLRKDQQAEELKQLKEGGDKNQNALNEKLNAEAERYNEQTGKIKTAAEQAADARIAAYERANRVIAATPPAELTAFQAAGLGTTASPTAPVTPNQATALPVATDKPIDTNTTVDPTQVMNVQVVSLALVRDEGVIAEIASLAARLEGKLGELAGIINGQTGTLGGKLDTVAGAIRSIKSARLVNG